jgi:DNA/RNA-binding domain of Phe-tRNA-synthetase-like protein
MCKNPTQITISKDILSVCPQFRFAAIECRVKNTPHNDALWQEIEDFSTKFRANFAMEAINKRPAIFATRQAYKKLGKDPNRYRPSAEALCRRIVKGMDLYQIDTLVDIINLVSLKTGYSIGGFDADKIRGNLTLGVGRANEQFEAIGRGTLNIEGLPVYRDETGGIGTPTSDEERTKITAETTHLLMIINGYSGEEGLREATDYSLELLTKYAAAILLFPK